MRWRGITSALALLLSMTACSSTPSTPTPLPSRVRTGPAGAAFYQPPSASAGAKPGDLIWARPIPVIGNGKGYEILYWSTTVGGKLVAVSGVLYQPQGKRPANSWPILAWAHGTFGLGDSCAPSLAYAQGTTTVTPLVQVAMNLGAVFVETDYQGLGTPGGLPYMVNQASARDLLDSIRAAANFVGAKSTNAVVIGASEGGSGAVMAAEMQPTYAPELHLRAAVGVSTPSQMNKLDEQLSGGNYFGYVLMAVFGYVVAYPKLAPRETALTAAGQNALKQIPTQCADQILGELSHRTEADLGTFNVLHAPDFSAALAENDLGLVKTKTGVPIFIVHGDQDDTIPVQDSHYLLRQLCAVGDTVYAKFYPGAGHVDVLQTALPDITAYLKDRLAGKPAPSSCAVGA
jgi:pimeloyl-ACP methyl ester carboxylesterase